MEIIKTILKAATTTAIVATAIFEAKEIISDLDNQNIEYNTLQEK